MMEVTIPTFTVDILPLVIGAFGGVIGIVFIIIKTRRPDAAQPSAPVDLDR